MVEKNEKDPGEQNRPRGSWGKTTLKAVLWLGLVAFAGILFVGGVVLGYVSSIVKDDPVRSRVSIEQKISTNNITGFAYFRDGTPIGQLRSEEDRRPVTFDKIPRNVIDAVLSIEDNDFYSHPGVDFKGTMRAVKQKVLNESTQTGGSTLTQQLARRVFLNLDRTDNRKVKEILLSLRLERFLSKQEILTAYLNKVPFGNGSNGYNVFGIQAAARGIFGIADLTKLNTAQSAYLAGLPQLPSAYSAYNGKGEFMKDNFKRAMKRQHLVLQRMLEENKINQTQYSKALSFDIKSSLAPQTKKAYDTYPYLMLETERQTAQVLALLKDPKLDKNNIPTQAIDEAKQQLMVGGYRIYTTIDPKIYSAMHKVSDNSNNFSPASKSKGLEQVAGMMIDHRTGGILGMIEGRSFYTEQMNYATQMVRQPGSTMKPIAAYLPALEKGLIQPAGIIDDSPMILRDYQKGFHIPVNSSGGYKGLVTARTALNESRNIPALKLFNQVVGIPDAWAFTKKLGITTIQKSDYQSQTGVLGGLKTGVSVQELTNAYGSIANQGVYNDSYMIDKITDSNGNVVYQHQLKPQQVFSKQTAFLMTDMLRTVISETGSTGHTVAKDFNKYGQIPIVGKTGTTQNYGDVWFMGYSPDVTLGVWVGYKEPKNTLETKAAKGRARSIWALVMNEVTAAKPEIFKTPAFNKPEGIVTRTVSGYSGLLPTALTRQAGKMVTDVFNIKYVPTKSDNVLVRAKYITYNGVNYIPHDETPSDMVKEKVVMRRDTSIKDLVDELQAAFSKMKGNHKPISFYMPKDAGEDAPSKVDPRMDDGHAPSAPTSVRVSARASSHTITFGANPERDVVGYRVYKSLDGNGFQYVNAVLTGEATRFNVGTSYGHNYSFYVTAVDVGGHESAPSTVVTSNGITSPLPDPIDPVVPDTDSPNEMPVEGTGNGQTGGDTNGDTEGTLSAPSVPHQLQGQVSTDGIRITWEANKIAEKVTGYNIYFADKDKGIYTLVATVRTNQYSFIAPSIHGNVRVTAVNSSGESVPTSSLTVEK
ncbi:penicillin-binding protein [Paenibacillus shirakamiensis]|uniref:Penicillin-binding protein n=1 Tax=Paenibacillus shirakamiensis TaxID=1265935 RepID=A0ABS4JFF6_9BACL|nr:transglycosylase domain-containing protein [Paenibacillus shirakamiensis]MBP1999319.1 penicillin-binding protein [Paenibacillus shirakamiensis]